MQKQIFNLSAGLDVQLLADFLDKILALGVGSQDLNNKLDISFFFSSYFYPFNTLCDVLLAGTLGYSGGDFHCALQDITISIYYMNMGYET